MKRSLFNLSHYHLLSGVMGNLIPVGLVEVLPGDTFQMNSRVLLRASPLLAPVMHPVRVQLSHWFVPNRLVWDEWEDFITGGPDGTSTPVFPWKQWANGGLPGTLPGYQGVPVTAAPINVNVLPNRGYNLIWNEWFRDQDLETPAVVSKASGQDTTTNSPIRQAAWEKDYFTSARPWEQKGPSITIPLGTSAPVVSSGTPIRVAESGQVNPSDLEFGESPGRVTLETQAGWASGDDIFLANTASGLQADLTGASAVTINILREAMALQRFEEARARFGSRYVEYLRYLGVRSSDARLARPEYLGGGTSTIQFSEVLQTAEGDDPVGELRGHGISAMRSNRFRRFFEEHGYIHTLMTVKPKTVYYQGLPRHYSRQTKEDFWQKELQHIGQQEVLNKEIYAAAGSGGTSEDVFGYQDRYDEYRRQESRVSGEFQSVLNFWHFARSFASAPALNASFVSCVPTEEPFAVPTQDTLYCMVRHSIKARRLVAKTGSSFIR